MAVKSVSSSLLLGIANWFHFVLTIEIAENCLGFCMAHDVSVDG